MTLSVPARVRSIELPPFDPLNLRAATLAERLGSYGISALADVEPHLSAKTRAVVRCNPSNPTGAALDPAEEAHRLEAGDTGYRRLQRRDHR